MPKKRSDGRYDEAWQGIRGLFIKMLKKCWDKLFGMKRLCKVLVFSVLIGSNPMLTQAQCSMCRAVLQSEEGQRTAEGINNGILYLMVIPYLLVGGVAYWIYRRRK